MRTCGRNSSVQGGRHSDARAGNDDSDLNPGDGGGHDEKGDEKDGDDDKEDGAGRQARRQNLKDLISGLQKKEGKDAFTALN